ncbi:MAG: hemolysin III family protein [Bacteroidales bacterium]|nr:hemolysin III family protein [Bacteroidales bacterium]MDY6405659.1 hemolysin III family protein [Bacteroidales bacterium]
MSSFATYWKNVPTEEKANTLTHVFPAIATLAIAWPLMALAYQSQITNHKSQMAGTSLFLLGMLLMFLSSTLYHAVTSPKHKARLRIFDHISIYIMIAGSYSLICLSVVGGWIGWSLFCFLWTCVLAGAIGKFVALGKHPKLSLALYLAMGWVALLILHPMWLHMSHAAFFWIIAEGVFYTIGSYFFNKDEEHAFYHAIWHVFITLGAASHTIATWLILS